MPLSEFAESPEAPDGAILLAFYRLALVSALNSAYHAGKVADESALTDFQKGFARGYEVGIRTSHSLVERDHTDLIDEWVKSKAKNTLEGDFND